MAEPMTENEANVRIARWVSVSAAFVFLAFFGAAGFGCKTSYDTWREVHRECVGGGGTFIPLNDGKAICLRDRRTTP